MKTTLFTTRRSRNTFLIDEKGRFIFYPRASSVDFASHGMFVDRRNIEFDYYAGYAGQLSRDWSWDASFVRYAYSGGTRVDYDYSELVLSVFYQDWLSGSIGVADDWLARGETSVDYNANFFYRTQAFGFSAQVGYGDTEDLLADSYLYWNVGLSRTFKGLALDLRY